MKENINPSAQMKKHTMGVLTLSQAIKIYGTERRAQMVVYNIVVWKKGFIISIGILHNIFKFLN